MREGAVGCCDGVPGSAGLLRRVMCLALLGVTQVSELIVLSQIARGEGRWRQLRRNPALKKDNLNRVLRRLVGKGLVWKDDDFEMWVVCEDVALAMDGVFRDVAVDGGTRDGGAEEGKGFSGSEGEG